jgi:hypothetical protein
MGWWGSWIAVRGAKDDVLAALDQVETDVEMQPGCGRKGLRSAEIADGWTVVYDDDMDWASRERVLDLSRLGLTVACRFEDKVAMTSAAWAARDGAELWRVFHDHEGSFYRLDVEGEPPTELSAIRERLFREQDEDGGETSSTDFVHDAPFELAQAVCGYRHDEDETPFVALKSSKALASPEPKPRGQGLIAKLLAPFRRA